MKRWSRKVEQSVQVQKPSFSLSVPPTHREEIFLFIFPSTMYSFMALEVTDTRWPPCPLQKSSASAQFLVLLLQRKQCWSPLWSVHFSEPNSWFSAGQSATHLLSPQPPSSALALVTPPQIAYYTQKYQTHVY